MKFPKKAKEGDNLGRPRKPVDLQLQEGKSHLTNEDVAEKRAIELKVETKEIKRPDFLPADYHGQYDKLADRLLELGIFTDLDEDLLGRYFVARELYVKYNSKLRTALKKRPVDLDEIKSLQTSQDKAFRQVRDCANDLGLSISSRVKLTLPKIGSDALDDEL